ncbi:type I methionyl aminopeptidase [Buchnera aphidicola]|uniref:Methionine aminopeptidase n=1 Tax=Buchnera aphidicola (Sarucallis kahawaluokalani) TaxID=1241878 RepID=A0A4D6Y7Q2_9GAMM|nr:type I methionyl aminopeptidase [Buchnera aphidicola]QCI25956.1 type I methionyl aminopeptidase [Buchnera aphidicola (Sarucallis kahawaluokalani)]
MHIYLKKNKIIEKMRISGHLASQVLRKIKPYIISGITTAELDNICQNYIIQKQAISGCLGYHGFPSSTCISVNEISCHGIPSKKKKLNNGDIVNIDVTVIKNKYYADTSKMFIVGKTKKIAYELCKAAKNSLYITFPIIKPGLPINIIGRTIQKYIQKTPFSIVKEYCGHGIGLNFHEIPYILHYDHYNTIILKQGMIFTIEPIINAGTNEVFCMNDNWTICTKDHNLSAQYEHTILVTKNGCEILTKRKNEKIKRIYSN